ncbi:hypothetical protein DXA96_02375 [Lachnospiraceae bacterium OF09-33XD]|nr:hypothetical protein DXA96_02375 [Lachnospiraceae bacterium OF09-33XD]
MGRDISQLHPRLQQKIAELKQLCANEGLPLGIGECFRSVAEQNACTHRDGQSLVKSSRTHREAVIPASINGA